MLPGPRDLAAARRDPRADLIAGITVAIVALPLALAFGVSSGLGAQAGLATAIVAGFVAAVFGGSNLQVSGPTGAMTVVLIPVVHRVGVEGALFAGLLAGIVLVAMAFARVGRYVRYLPLPVVEGFTAGIAVVIALQQVPAALGVEAGEGDRVLLVAVDAVRSFVDGPQIASLVMAAGVVAMLLIGARWRPGIPFSLVAVIIATVVTKLAGLDVAVIGALPPALPAPSLSFVDPAVLSTLIGPALAIAALAALESLLSATVADGMSVSERHDPDRELFGQGLANLAAPLFGGVPATAAIARTAVNVRAGAVSRAAAATHALVLAVFVLAASSLVAEIPMPALAGVLLATTIRMVDPATVRGLLRSTRGDAATLLLTFAVTVAVDLVTAVAVGVVLAMGVALRTIARTATFDAVPLDAGDHSAEEHALLSDRIVAYRPEGPLFFGAANRFLAELSDVGDVDAVILRMSRISTIDATGAAILGDAIEHLERRGIPVLLSGITEEHHGVLDALRVGPTLRAQGHIFPDTPSAIFYARTHLVHPPPQHGLRRARALAG
jgi:SulP family sulfate permease